MAEQDEQHPSVNETADELLTRAYALEDDSQAHALYADWAKTYDETMLSGLGYQTPEKTAQLLQQYLPATSDHLLDVGAGTGLAGAALRKLGYWEIDALDFSPAMLEVARHRRVYQSLIKADLNAPLDISGNTYDAMICTGTFTHAHVGAKCLHELFRVLKPGGVFACTVHKEIWQPMGFAETVAELKKAGTIQILHHQEGTYYARSEAPEGWYCVWQKR